MYIQIPLFLTLVIITRKAYQLMPERDVFDTTRSLKQRISATKLKIDRMVRSHTERGGRIPYEQGVAPIEHAIARVRVRQAEPGATGVTALDKFDANWRPLLLKAQAQGGFLSIDYALALLGVIEHEEPGDHLRTQIRIGMTAELEKQIPEIQPLLKKYRKASAKLIDERQQLVLALK